MDPPTGRVVIALLPWSRSQGRTAGRIFTSLLTREDKYSGILVSCAIDRAGVSNNVY
jgi:hypothetical protein